MTLFDMGRYSRCEYNLARSNIDYSLHPTCASQ